MDSITLAPVQSVGGTVRLPGSKSISNRALLLGALASGRTTLHNLLTSDDTKFMIRALRKLGVAVDATTDAVVVAGKGGVLIDDPQFEAELDLGLAGTAIRPLTAALTLGAGRYTVDGNARMRERPIDHLVDALRLLGADIRYVGAQGFPPLDIRGGGLRGGTTRVDGSISSQFLTSLLLAAPLAQGPVHVTIDGELVSKPYLDITLDIMRRFGADVSHDNYRSFSVTPGGYQSPGDYLVEGDASSASYFLAAGAVTGTGITVEGIGRDSVQGDVAFVDVLRAMGATVTVNAQSVTVHPAATLKGVDLDLNHIPDAAMTAATLALHAQGRTRIRNIYNWRVKETDRLAAMATELRKLGAAVTEGPDFIEIDPPERLSVAAIDTYGDHRMAMAFSLVCLGGAPVTINEPDCVAKTFPDYFQQFESICAA